MQIDYQTFFCFLMQMKGEGDFIRRFLQKYIKKLLKSGSGMFSSSLVIKSKVS